MTFNTLCKDNSRDTDKLMTKGTANIKVLIVNTIHEYEIPRCEGYDYVAGLRILKELYSVLQY